MAFALMMTTADMGLLYWCLAHDGQTGQDRNRSNQLLNGGIDKWTTSSRVPVSHPYYDNDPDMILVVVNVTFPIETFRQETIAFARKYPWASQLESLANEHWRDPCYAVEPWPYSGDPWAGIPREPPYVPTTTTTTTPPPITTTTVPPLTTTTPPPITTTTPHP